MSISSLQACDATHGDGPAPYREPMVVYLDIKTASSGEWLREQIAGLDPVDASVWAAEHAGDMALTPVHGRVVCWAIATSVGTQWVRSGVDEVDLLRRLYRALIHCAPIQIVAHYGSSFDFPFLRARALALAGRIDTDDAAGRIVQGDLEGLARWLWAPKPWDTRLVDTCTPEWAPLPARGRPGDGWARSLDDLATLLGVARSQTIPSAEIPRAWYLGQHAEVESHCLDDVRTLRWVHRRLAVGRGPL